MQLRAYWIGLYLAIRHHLNKDSMQQSWLPKLVELLTESMPPGSNVARTLSDLLNVSIESAYRRLRGETSFVLEELLILRKELGISVDGLVDNGDVISIQMRSVFDVNDTLEPYLEDLNSELSNLIRRDTTIYCLAADIPLFRLLAYKHLAAFKLFYWQKSILAFEKFQTSTFGTNEEPNIAADLCEKLAEQYRSCHSIEIWNEQTISVTLKQVEYYSQCAYFANEESLFQVYRDIIQLITDVSMEARSAVKRNSTNTSSVPYALWNCELVIDSSSVLIQNDAHQVLAIGLNSFNTFRVSHPTVIREYRSWLKSMLSRSTLLSGQADKHRIHFVQQLIDRIEKSAESHLSTKYYEALVKEHIQDSVL